MHWKIKALFQKILSTTKLGDRLNHVPATLNKKYHYNVAFYQTHECIRKFNHSTIDLSGNKTALEIGTGYSLVSCIVLALLGFKKIVTVDVSKDIQFSTLKKQVRYLENPEILEQICEKSIFNKQQVIAKINQLRNVDSLATIFSLFNITYITPYSFKAIFKVSTKFDYICSQVVLEHVKPNNLDELFKFTKQVLAKGQFCVHTINFIDHFANPGVFQDKSISEFNFLKYSNQYWNYWAGNSIAYTNRLSYIYYVNLCEKHNLTCVDFIGENYRTQKALDSKLIHPDVLKMYKPNVKIEELTKYQRGTLIIANT